MKHKLLSLTANTNVEDAVVPLHLCDYFASGRGQERGISITRTVLG